jgi:hypothetical protein
MIRFLPCLVILPNCSCAQAQQERPLIFTDLRFGAGFSPLVDRRFEARPLGDGTYQIVAFNDNPTVLAQMAANVHVMSRARNDEGHLPDNVLTRVASLITLGTWSRRSDTFGLTFGSNFASDGAQSMLMGLSLFYGQQADAALTFGILVKQIDRLRFDSVGDIISVANPDTRRVWESGLYIGFSYKGVGGPGNPREESDDDARRISIGSGSKALN